MAALVEILYLTWNRLSYTKFTLPQVLDNGGDVDYQVYIVDNGSTDGTVEYLKSLDHPRIKTIIYHKENKGISPVSNAFWAQASKDGVKYVGKVDNDINLPDKWLEPLVKTQEVGDSNVGVVGLTHFHKDDIYAMNRAAYLHNIKKLADGTRVLVQTHLGGACYIYPVTMFKKFGAAKIHNDRKKHGWTEKQNEFFNHNKFPCYVFPFITCQHLDDPRYPETLTKVKPEIVIKQTVSRRRAYKRLLTDKRPSEHWDRAKG